MGYFIKQNFSFTHPQSPYGKAIVWRPHQFIRAALAQTGGRRNAAALLLGWGRNTLTRKMAELNL